MLVSLSLCVCMGNDRNTQVTCEGGARVVFEGTSTSSGVSYAVTLNLLNDIDADKTKIEIGARNVFLVVFKAERSEEGEGWGRLTMEKTGMRHVKVDWNKWKGAAKHIHEKRANEQTQTHTHIYTCMYVQ